MLTVENLRVRFEARGGLGTVRAVDGVSFQVAEGESVGLVGESGCGKTTVANALLGLLPPAEGRVRFRGRDVDALAGGDLARFRRSVQMIFQDPAGSLNPRLTVGSAIQEVLCVHRLAGDAAGRRARVAELLAAVGLEPEHGGRYPHELSGGQKQRIGLARALAVGPSLLICDEPVSALDVSVQVQILNLLNDIRRQAGLACLFISHDLAAVRYVADRILVMYLGRIVESAPCGDFFGRPCHPYSEALVSAIPDVERGLRARREGTRRIVLRGDVPSAAQRIPGCPFHPRCHRAQDLCGREAPGTVRVGAGHASVCHFARALAGEGIPAPPS